MRNHTFQEKGMKINFLYFRIQHRMTNRLVQEVPISLYFKSWFKFKNKKTNFKKTAFKIRGLKLLSSV